MLKLRSDKLTANAMWLLVATTASGIGVLAFWEVAARTHRASAVGSVFAEVSAFTFLGVVAQLNLTNVFIRFLPAAGQHARSFVFRGYTAVCAVGIVAGIGFLLGGFASHIVPAGFPNRVLFVGAVPLFAVFALEDSVMTALRITRWVPIENGTTGLFKLLLLPILVFLPARSAILVAWIVPVAAAVVIVNAYLFGRMLPSIERRESDDLPSSKRLMSFVVAEYLTSLCNMAALQVVPLIVVWRLGPTAGAYFAIPWLICNSITMVMWNVGSSFIVEVVTAGAYSMHMMVRTLQIWAAVGVVALVGVLLVGPVIVSLAGSGYGAHGSTFVRIVAISVPFTVVRVLYQAFTWLDQRVWFLLAVSAVSAGMLIGLSFLLSGSYGIVGVAWAYLASQVVSAALMLPSVGSRLRAIRQSDGPLRLQGTG
jgi:O-antigen/teichoic acid export membrane protein